MRWPPTVGQPLPDAEHAYGIHPKLTTYCLNLDHEVGGSKARGFVRILGIGLADIDYLAETLRAGVLNAPIADVRDNAPYGVLCEVRIEVAGLREHRDRVAAVTTSWELREVGAAPRLVTAYIDG